MLQLLQLGHSSVNSAVKSRALASSRGIEVSSQVPDVWYNWDARLQGFPPRIVEPIPRSLRGGKHEALIRRDFGPHVRQVLVGSPYRLRRLRHHMGAPGNNQ